MDRITGCFCQWDPRTGHSIIRRASRDRTSSPVDSWWMQAVTPTSLRTKGLSKEDGKLAVFVGVYNASGRLQRVYRLEEQAWLPEPFENVHLDDGGYLWVQQPPHLLVFDPRGVRQYAADWPLGLVDADGHNYVTRTIDPDVSSASETGGFD